ncbi:MAG: hypothetical protein QOE86_133 [Solirubrobacteraceae bacterium]|nr:hypothetical protein [Solirubrobacteraceae bacterium]
MQTPGALKAAFAVILIGLVAVAVLASGGQGGGILGASNRPALADPIPYDGRSPAQPAGARERVLVELPRPALGALANAETLSPRRQRSYVASLENEARALLGALDARGVKTTDVVTFERTWHGFAATVSAKDLPGLESLGVRLRADRRLYPAVGEPLGTARRVAPPPAGAPALALIAGGRALNGLRDVVLSRGVRVRALAAGVARRSAPHAPAEEYARTDEVLAALEHAVDRNFDGDTTDHARVALLGMSAPYAGFSDAPEAQAAAGAQRLGTLLVVPSGHEAKGTAAFGTIGSPGAAAAALTVAPLSSGADVARATVHVGGVDAPGAAVLGRGIPSGVLRTSPTVTADDPAKLPDLAGRLAVVRAGANPSAQAAAAAAAGARAVLLAEPRDGVPVPSMPAGRIAVPVLGVTGVTARAVLAAKPGATATAAGLRLPRRLTVGRTVSRFASTGPAFDGAAKPELARPGSALAGGRLIAGAGVAAALAAVDAARLGQGDPQAARQRLLAQADWRPARRRDPGPTRVPVGTPSVRRTGAVTGVEFTVGTFGRGDPAASGPTTIVPAARLTLTLERADGTTVETLTPTGGERDVLPGRYAYTLPAAVVGRLTAGSYRFRVAASAPRQRRPTIARSASFRAA